ncbi:hypothetical protein SeLEV6574_g05284 [Synchytrium endobioticum]|uniref:Uncharacterized protein n=1 Tax=Synchytrium endobioticum TaxID=286115 RepID=A0A507CV04_9FUNG|nr:hypothetical protein SeLEV6574_g05284 [Synchytrium endobioticum]
MSKVDIPAISAYPSSKAYHARTCFRPMKASSTSLTSQWEYEISAKFRLLDCTTDNTSHYDNAHSQSSTTSTLSSLPSSRSSHPKSCHSPDEHGTDISLSCTPNQPRTQSHFKPTLRFADEPADVVRKPHPRPSAPVSIPKGPNKYRRTYAATVTPQDTLPSMPGNYRNWSPSDNGSPHELLKAATSGMLFGPF